MTALLGIFGAVITASLIVVHLVGANLSEFRLSPTEAPAKSLYMVRQEGLEPPTYRFEVNSTCDFRPFRGSKRGKSWEN
jgi:hypothetical protein